PAIIAGQSRGRDDVAPSRSCKVPAKIKIRGGTDGRTYPGSLDCEKLKKIKGTSAQQAKKTVGDWPLKRDSRARRTSAPIGIRSAVQGKIGKKRIGGKNQKGCGC